MALFMTWYLMRAAAFERHRILVEMLYAPGPRRDIAHEEHRLIVKMVYGA